jgi:hypothetical protein
MMRPYNKQSVCSILVCLAMCFLGSTHISRAQYSRFETPAIAPTGISPFASLFGSLNNLVYNTYDYNGTDQSWDNSAMHYRGMLLSYLRYPELPKAGYSSFSLTTMKEIYLNQGDDMTSLKNIIAQTEHQAGMDDLRTRISYHYDSAGWLRAIITKTITPEVEAYTETWDSLFYSFYANGSVVLRWQQDQLATSAGYVASTSCGAMPPFHKFYRHTLITVSLDSFHNVTSIESRTDELRDTCREGGTKVSRRTMTYDREGKALSMTDSSSAYPAAHTETLISYEAMPFDKLALVLKDQRAFEPLHQPIIKSWLETQGPLSAVVQRRSTRNYLNYDSRLRQQVLRRDSPFVYSDTSFFVLNVLRQRVIYVPAGNRKTFSFYTRAADPLTSSVVLRVQNLPGPPEPTATPAVVCDPLALSTIFTQRKLIKKIGSQDLTIYATDETHENYGSYRESQASQQFRPSIPDDINFRIRSMLLKDAQGLVKYLWLPDHAYKLSYQ